MASRKRSIKNMFLRRSARGSSLGATRRRRLPLHLEHLEQRMLMDGAGFVHTDPDPDPGSVVGVSGIEAQDDHVKLWSGTQQLRIDVLGNDPLPDGSEHMQIKSVSETLRGATVAISDDGLRIIYTVPGEGAAFDTFYYIVEDSEGNLGKANVNVGTKFKHSPSTVPTRPSGNDSFDFFEDGAERQLNVLRNDGPFSGGEILEVTALGIPKGIMSIAEDGKSLLYQPDVGITGYDSYQYTVRIESGETETFRVSIHIKKPVHLRSDQFALDINTGPHEFNVLANDRRLTPTPESLRIESVTEAPFGGELSVSEDGLRVLFEPVDDFIGAFSFAYTVRYGPDEHQTISGSGHVNVSNTFLAVDNWFMVDPDSADNPLDVLANDPILKKKGISVTIVDVGAGDQGGQVAIEDGQSLRYTPAAGFTGEETFVYTVEDANGHRQSATVSVLVDQPIIDPVGVPKFILPGELEQFLIDQAVEKYQYQFGLFGVYWSNYQAINLGWSDASSLPSFLSIRGAASQFDSVNPASISHSETNTQEAGVDEADIVETDGRYVYTFSHGELVIADLADPENPLLVSFTAFDDHYKEMYLQGDRITLINRGSYNGSAVLTVLDVSDRSNPTVVERTEIDGIIVDSRAVGDQVYIAARGLQLPVPESHELSNSGDVRQSVKVAETLEEYLARVRETLVDDALPSFRTFAGDGSLLASGLLTDPSAIHKPLDDIDDSLLSLVTFDVGDDQPGPIGSAGIFTSSAAEVYMSGNSFYVMRNAAGETAIFKFDIAEDGTPTLVATGKVDGTLLNQFSVDEHDGRLRIATTQTVRETYRDAWGRERFRQQRRFNNLFVLEQQGAQLEIVGKIENLAPTETIKSVRFLDDRAYVVTFRVIDPLFAIDLSDPVNPTVEGSLKIPGFSDYLHPVDEDYLIGIGRDADEITGRLGPVQISLFYVGDLSNPTLVDQVTMEGARWTNSEAWSDHHAASYFAEDQILTLPVSWSDTTGRNINGVPLFGSWGGYTQHSAIWAFEIDVDQQGGGSIEVAGSVKHEGQARRSIRLGDSLVTISQDYIKVNDLHDIDQQLAEIYLGPLPVADQFTIQEDSGENVLDVLANDHPGVDGELPIIVDVTQPTQHGYILYSGLNDSTVGVVEISEDGRSLIFTPHENFFGTATFTYTVFDELRGEQDATVTINVKNVPDEPDAVDDEFEVDPDSGPTVLNVLANDNNVDSGFNRPTVRVAQPVLHTIDLAFPVLTQVASLGTIGLSLESRVFSDVSVDSLNYHDVLFSSVHFGNGLTITDVSPTDNGGTVEIDQWGQLVYTPAAGFEGLETFTYTIETKFGLSDVGTVTVRVGTIPEEPDNSEALPNPELNSSQEQVLRTEPTADLHDVGRTPSQADNAESLSLLSRKLSGLFTRDLDIASSSELIETAPDLITASLFDTVIRGLHRGLAHGEQTISVAESLGGNGNARLSALSGDPIVIDSALSAVVSADNREIRFSLDDGYFDCLAHDSLECDQDS